MTWRQAVKGIAVVWAAIGACLLLSLSGCTDEDGTVHALRVAGFKNIRTTGYSWFSCGEKDDTCTGFEATAPDGEQVHGAVSCGYWSWSKGCTIRMK